MNEARNLPIVSVGGAGSTLPDGRNVDFVVVVVVFVLFVAGMLFVIQGFVGKEIYPEGLRFRADFDRPGISHPPERHRGRLMAIGGAMMVLAVLFGLLVI